MSNIPSSHSDENVPLNEQQKAVLHQVGVKDVEAAAAFIDSSSRHKGPITNTINRMLGGKNSSPTLLLALLDHARIPVADEKSDEQTVQEDQNL